MARAVLGSATHPAFDAVAAVCDRQAGWTAELDLAPGDRVALLVGYDTLPDVDRRLARLAPKLEGCDVLVVAPDVNEGSLEGAPLARARGVVPQAIVLAHAPPIEGVLAARRDLQLTGTLSLPMSDRALPFVAWCDVASAAVAWLVAPTPERADHSIIGPEALSGDDLAAVVARLIADIAEPRRFAAERLRDMDENGDGVVTTEEAARFLATLGHGPDAAAQLVAVADLDGDGTISLDEMIDGIEGQLTQALAELPTEVSFHPTLPHLARERWIAVGVPYGEARGFSEHLRHTTAGMALHTMLGGTPAYEALEPHASSFVNLFIVPGLGLMSLREGRFGDPTPAPPELLWEHDDPQLGDTALLSHLVLADGGRLDTRKTASGVVESRWHCEPGTTEVLRFGAGDEARAIELADGRVVGVACRGRWPGLRDTMLEVMEQRLIRPWERALFRELGALRLEHVDEVADPDEMVCHCVRVRRKALVQAADEGCTTLAAIVERTRATSVCGGCTPLVEEILGSQKLEVAEIRSIERLGDRYVKLTLDPVTHTPEASLPGQHIVIQGRINGRWTTRAYSLTSAGGAAHPYEITVKREELGLFSRWLADQAHGESLVKCSRPTGDFFLAPEDSGPVFMFAGGIGITPGIALARTLGNDGDTRRLHVDWSARRDDDFIFAPELDALSAATAHRISWRRRQTARTGRLDAATVRELYPYTPGALAFLCGPDRYIAEVRAYLRAAGWPEGAIRVELFSSQVDDEGHVSAKAIAARGDGATSARSGEASSASSTTPPPVQHTSFFLDLRERRPILLEAEAFLGQMYREVGAAGVLPERLAEIRDEVERTGTYTHTSDEVTYGARLAWRNATRCVGRFFWNHLVVRDMRHLESEEQMFQAIVEHMRFATNGGDLISTLTLFRPGPPTIRLFNSQLVRYAAHVRDDGSVLGDPANLELTEQAEALGWRGAGTAFDVLPIIIQIGDRAPRWFELPEDAVLQVPLEHPTLPWFAELGLRWYALPAVCEIALDLGGVQYRCVPFNGFYMVTEIGARNLSDPGRYNLLPVVADKMGLDTKTSATLWKDRAMVELSTAVLHSFQKRRVRMLDHHAACDYFLQFERQELAQGRPVYGDWSWLVPPMSGSASPLWFRNDLQNMVLKPMYGYQHPPWHGDSPPPAHEGPIPPCPHASKGRLR